MAEVAGSIPVGPTNLLASPFLSPLFPLDAAAHGSAIRLCVSVPNFHVQLLMVVVASPEAAVS
jgi:hypothetical protein